MTDDIAAVQLPVPAAAPAMDAAARAAQALDHTRLDPPHLSLGYPWPPLIDLDAVVEVARTTSPLHVHLDEFGAWGSARPVVHLRVAPPEPVRQLAVRLGWPEAGDLTPHVSLVRLDGDPRDHQVDAVMAAARRHTPGAVLLDRIEVTVRRAGEWREVGTFPLDGDPVDTPGR